MYGLQIFTVIHSIVASSLCWFPVLRRSFLVWWSPICLFLLLLSVLFGSYPKTSVPRPVSKFPYIFLLISLYFQLSRLSLKSILSWFLYLIWDKGHISFSACREPILPAPCFKETVLSPLYALGNFVEDQLIISVLFWFVLPWWLVRLNIFPIFWPFVYFLLRNVYPGFLGLFKKF